MSLQNNPMWTQLAEREKRLVIGLVVFLVMMAFYSLVWSPIHAQYSQQKAALQKAETEWLWLVEQAPKVIQSPRGTQLAVHSKTALMDSLQKSLRQQNLLQFTEGLNLTNRGIQVRFEEVDAPRLFRWIGGLEQQGLIAKSIKLTPVSEGLTEAKLLYEVAQ
ncbi:MAG TPA: type II secretion system protein M [Thiomicrorhabdus sp.]|nr:type II secretion system protein M [Thiomicrorhabdus sp.]